VLAPEDAQLALKHGAHGIIVSNHGGRQLDYAPSALDALPEVVEAVRGSGAPVLMDGGVRCAARGLVFRVRACWLGCRDSARGRLSGGAEALGPVGLLGCLESCAAATNTWSIVVKNQSKVFNRKPAPRRNLWQVCFSVSRPAQCCPACASLCRRGTDVVKALALGAKAVLLGRPVLYGLALSGQAGVEKVLATLHKELELAMALCGATRVEELGPQLLLQVGAGGGLSRVGSGCGGCGECGGTRSRL
jgi:hypothetical protein